MLNGDPLFRPYIPSDLQACAKLAEEAWPYGRAMFTAPSDISTMTGYIQSTLIYSTWTEVVMTSGEIAGFLFGRIKGQKTSRSWLRSMREDMGTFPRMLFARNIKPGKALKMLFGISMTELKVAVNRPRSDAEIELLIVAGAHRGSGIGKRLVDRFVEAARRAGASVITVYTDDKTSNWQFYERYGFKKVATFYDNVSSYFADVDSNGLIYALDVKGRMGPDTSENEVDELQTQG